MDTSIGCRRIKRRAPPYEESIQFYPQQEHAEEKDIEVKQSLKGHNLNHTQRPCGKDGEPWGGKGTKRRLVKGLLLSNLKKNKGLGERKGREKRKLNAKKQGSSAKRCIPQATWGQGSLGNPTGKIQAAMPEAGKRIDATIGKRVPQERKRRVGK